MVSGWWYAKQIIITKHPTKFKFNSSKRVKICKKGGSTGSCSGEVTYLFEIAQLTEMLERKEKYARVPQSLRFFGTMSVYITTLSLTKRPPIQLVGQDGKIADKKISPIEYLNLRTQTRHIFTFILSPSRSRGRVNIGEIPFPLQFLSQNDIIPIRK